MNPNSSKKWAVYRVLPGGKRERVNEDTLTEVDAKKEATRLLTEATASGGKVQYVAKMLING